MARKRRIDEELGIRPTDSMPVAGRKTLIGCLDRVQALLSQAIAHNPKSSTIHQMRVWTRRAVAAIDLYQGCLPEKSTRWRKKLQKLRRAANDARNLDVLDLRLALSKDKADQRWRDAIQPERQDARRHLRRMAEAHETEARLKRWKTKIAQAMKALPRDKGAKRKLSTSRWVHTRLQPILVEYVSHLHRAKRSEQELHQFRIQGKALRYSLELLGSTLDQDSLHRILKALRAVQERLGAINDHATALEDLTRRLGSSKVRRDRSGWRTLIRRERQRMRSAICRFQSWMDVSRQEAIKDAIANLAIDKPQSQSRLKRTAEKNGHPTNGQRSKRVSATASSHSRQAKAKAPVAPRNR